MTEVNGRTSGLLIRPYEGADEDTWLECRVLSFLHTPYFDDVLQRRPHYDNPSIELVAESGGRIVGLIDVECELTPGSICFRPEGLGGVIWNLAVHPERQRQGVGKELLLAAESSAKGLGVTRFEAWTREDPGTNGWYEGNGFTQVYSYLHVYIAGAAEAQGVLGSTVDHLKVVKSFAHYTGTEVDDIKRRFRRVHECRLYEREL